MTCLEWRSFRDPARARLFSPQPTSVEHCSLEYGHVGQHSFEIDKASA